MGKLIDLTGQRFGRLTVVERYADYITPKGVMHTRWRCACDCGRFKIVRRSHLMGGNVTSCGCKAGHRTHNQSKTRLYHIWSNMHGRCHNKSHPQYGSYGGRGISVCEEWHHWEHFRDWSLENGYRENLSIDRIDNDKGYSPDNCRWATAIQQANNTRKTHLITYNGKTQSVSQWARELNIKQSTLSMRINKYGWGVDKALGKELKKHGS